MSSKTTTAKRVRLSLEGLNGNAFNLLGTFQVAARFQGWSDEDIKAVCDEATAGDYDHLLRVLIAHTTDPREDDDRADNE